MRERGVKGPKAGTAKEQASITQAVPHEVRKAAIASAVAAMISGPAGPASADWYGSAFAQCEGTTAATVRCLDRLTANWQARLDRAYETLHAQQETPERKAALEETQRLWAEYRQANCIFYRRGSGSIAAIEAAECMRVLTSRRARELEQAAGQEPN